MFDALWRKSDPRIPSWLIGNLLQLCDGVSPKNYIGSSEDFNVTIRNPAKGYGFFSDFRAQGAFLYKVRGGFDVNYKTLVSCISSSAIIVMVGAWLKSSALGCDSSAGCSASAVSITRIGRFWMCGIPSPPRVLSSVLEGSSRFPLSITWIVIFAFSAFLYFASHVFTVAASFIISIVSICESVRWRLFVISPRKLRLARIGPSRIVLSALSLYRGGESRSRVGAAGLYREGGSSWLG